MLIPCGADRLPAAQTATLSHGESYAVPTASSGCFWALVPTLVLSGPTLQPGGQALHPPTPALPTVNPDFPLFQHHVHQAFPSTDGLWAKAFPL